MIRVKQFSLNGRPQVDQIIVSTDTHDYLVSYGKPVVAYNPERVRLYRYWNHSRTTAKCVIHFLGCKDSKEVREKIESGEYELVDEITMS